MRVTWAQWAHFLNVNRGIGAAGTVSRKNEEIGMATGLIDPSLGSWCLADIGPGSIQCFITCDRMGTAWIEYAAPL